MSSDASKPRTSKQQLDQSVTEGKQAETALPESELRFRAIWEGASDAMAISAPDGTVVAANPAYYRLYGYTPENILGKNFAIIFPEEERKSAQELYAYVFQSPTISPSFEATIRRADGTERIVESSYSFIMHNGVRTAMISIIRDITTQKNAELALRESKLKLQLALEAGQMGTWNWDIMSNTIHWSANLELAFGFTPGTFNGTFEAFLERVHPEDRSLVNQEIRRTLEEGDDYKIEFRVIFPDGSIHWTRTHGHVLSDDAGQPVCLIGVCMDITKRKHVEEA